MLRFSPYCCLVFSSRERDVLSREICQRTFSVALEKNRPVRRLFFRVRSAYHRSFIFLGVRFQFIFVHNHDDNRAKVSTRDSFANITFSNYIIRSLLFKSNFHVIRVFIESRFSDSFEFTLEKLDCFILACTTVAKLGLIQFIFLVGIHLEINFYMRFYF